MYRLLLVAVLVVSSAGLAKSYECTSYGHKLRQNGMSIFDSVVESKINFTVVEKGDQHFLTAFSGPLKMWTGVNDTKKPLSEKKIAEIIKAGDPSFDWGYALKAEVEATPWKKVPRKFPKHIRFEIGNEDATGKFSDFDNGLWIIPKERKGAFEVVFSGVQASDNFGGSVDYECK